MLESVKYRYTRRYLAKRFLNAFLVFFIVLLLDFLIPRLMPGNFALIYYASLLQDTTGSGVNATAVFYQIERQFGLTQPIYQQFYVYLHQVFSLPPNFGPSFEYYPYPAWSVVVSALKWTLLLLGTSQAISWALGVGLGVYLAVNKGKLVDKVLEPLLLFVLSIPPFWFGLVLILVFAIELRLVPPVGAYSLHPTLGSILLHMILPMTTIVVATLPSHAIVIRNSALEVLSSDFALAMRAQGLRRRTFMSKVVKNSVLPSLTQLFLSLGYLFGGIYVVEYTFSYPGVGTVIANAIFSRDYPVLEAGLFVTTLAIIAFNIAADLMYPLLDPRISYVD